MIDGGLYDPLDPNAREHKDRTGTDGEKVPDAQAQLAEARSLGNGKAVVAVLLTLILACCMMYYGYVEGKREGRTHVATDAPAPQK